MCPRAEQAEPERCGRKGNAGESLGVTGAAIERPFEGVLEATAMDCFVASLLAMTYAGAASRGSPPPFFSIFKSIHKGDDKWS